MVNLCPLVNGTSMPMNNFKIPMVPGTTMPLPTSVGAIGVPAMFNGGAIGMGMVPGGIPTQSQALKPLGTVPMTGMILVLIDME